MLTIANTEPTQELPKIPTIADNNKPKNAMPAATYWPLFIRISDPCVTCFSSSMR